MHTLAFVVSHAGFFFDHWLWHPLHGNGYQFWSGVGSDASEITLLGLAIGAWRHINCHSPWCFRIGKHQLDGTPYKLCKKHHPQIPNDLSLEHIHKEGKRNS